MTPHTLHARSIGLAAGLALTLSIATACAETPAPDQAITVKAQAVPLLPADPDLMETGRLIYRGGLVLTSETAEFGGLSGLMVSADGTAFRAVSDRGAWVTGRLRYDGRGWLAGVDATRIAPVLDAEGRPVTGEASDAEALTGGAGPDGPLLVSFEREHRIWRYGRAADAGLLPPESIPLPPGADLPNNGGLEALALRQDGSLLAIAEDATDTNGDTRAWLIAPDGTAGAFGIVRTEPYAPTDAALAPDGSLLLLERRFSRASGVGMRLRRIPGDALVPGARADGEVLATLGMAFAIDNMEALSVRQADTGELLVYVLSDDNFNAPIQRTMLLMFAVRTGEAGPQ